MPKVDVKVLVKKLNPYCTNALEAHAVDLPLFQQLMRKELAALANESAEAIFSTAEPQDSNSTDSALMRFGQDLTAAARAHKIDPVLGREPEIRQMIDILCRRRKNNLILVGEAGVGKTALVEGLASKIVAGQVPDMLAKVKLMTLDLSLVGEFEQHLKSVLQEIENSLTPIILFIDEAHLLIGSGGKEGHNAANLLKPALARGKIRVIAATTWSKYKKHIETDAALSRRFQLIKVEEPDAPQTLTILRGLRAIFEESHCVMIRDDALQACTRLSTQYLPDRHQPDKAIDVLDTACARVHVNLKTKPAELVAHLEQRWQQELKLVKTLLALRLEIDIEISQGKKSKKLQHKREQLYQKLARLRGHNPLVFYEVDPDVIAGVIADWTHIPLGKLLRDEAENLLILPAQLEGRIKGQSQGIGMIAEQLKLAKAGLKDPKQPLGVFLLVGPSGVGKTETALTVADTLFGGETSLISINMSEFQERHTVSRLIGSPPGYVGYGEGGMLTEAVRKRPYSVVLLDEVEKAHPDVLNLFYQVFDKGSLTDGEGREVDFSNAVIFLTSNLATEQITELSLQEEPFAEIITQIRPVLSHWFKPALLARMTLIPYLALNQASLLEIVAQKLKKIEGRLHHQYQVALHWDLSVSAWLVQQCQDVEMGARNIDLIMSKKILPLLAEYVLEHRLERDFAESLTVAFDCKKQEIVLKLNN